MEKTRENFLFTARQDLLIQSVEKNLTIIFVKEWRFFVESEQSYKFFRFFPQIAVSFKIIAILGDLPIALRRQYKVVLPSQNDGF